MGYDKQQITEMLPHLWLRIDLLRDTLTEALRYPDKDEVDRILGRDGPYTALRDWVSRYCGLRKGVFFQLFYQAGPFHIHRNAIRGRDLVILFEQDLQDTNNGIVILLHEAAHFLCEHGNHPGERMSFDDIKKRYNEDESVAWSCVKEWLEGKPEFIPVIFQLELKGYRQ
jgi:hypothetical protein